MRYFTSPHRGVLQQQQSHHDQYKTVFISPDRSAHERAEHKRLVLELKEKAGQEPNKIYFIKEGQLCSKAIVKND